MDATENNVPPPEEPISSIERTIIEAQVIEAIQTCYDPEIPVNIYELGLIYEVKISETANVDIKMTLTSPHCPAAQSLPSEVRLKAQAVKGVKNVNVEVVWTPPWSPALMTEAAKLELGMM
jgi:FeS assembly SUF system protein